MSGEIAFFVTEGTVNEMTEVLLKDIGFTERAHLQRWIEDHPEIVGPDLLVVTTELDKWELGPLPVKDRFDVLFLDSFGALVVAELKRGEAPDTVDLQALKYAAYCSQLTVEDVVGDYARYHGVDEQKARETIFEHAPSWSAVALPPSRCAQPRKALGPR